MYHIPTTGCVCLSWKLGKQLPDMKWCIRTLCIHTHSDVGVDEMKEYISNALRNVRRFYVYLFVSESAYWLERRLITWCENVFIDLFATFSVLYVAPLCPMLKGE